MSYEINELIDSRNGALYEEVRQQVVLQLVPSDDGWGYYPNPCSLPN